MQPRQLTAMGSLTSGDLLAPKIGKALRDAEKELLRLIAKSPRKPLDEQALPRGCTVRLERRGSSRDKTPQTTHRLEIKMPSHFSAHILLPPRISIFIQARSKTQATRAKQLVIEAVCDLYASPVEDAHSDSHITKRLGRNIIEALRGEQIRVNSAVGTYYAIRNRFDHEESAIKAFSYRAPR